MSAPHVRPNSKRLTDADARHLLADDALLAAALERRSQIVAAKLARAGGDAMRGRAAG